MKLLEEMEVELNSISRTDIMSNKSLTIDKNPLVADDENAKSLISKGLNGIEYPASSITNGQASLIRPTMDNADSDALGFEVESYSDFNSPLPQDSHSEDKYNDQEDKIQNISKNSCENGTNNEELNCDSEKLASDTSCNEPDLTLDSSLMSEEFQLRLSDDEEETSLDRSLKSEAVSRTQATSADNINKDGDNLSGSGTSEGTALANDSLCQDSMLKPKDTAIEDVLELQSSTMPNLDSSVKDHPENSILIHISADNEDKITSNNTIDNSSEENDALEKDVLSLNCSVSGHDEKSAHGKLKEADQSEKPLLSPRTGPVISPEDIDKLDAEIEAEIAAKDMEEAGSSSKDKTGIPNSDKHETMEILDKECEVSNDKCDNATEKSDIVNGKRKILIEKCKVSHEECEASLLQENCIPFVKKEDSDVEWTIVKQEPLDEAGVKEKFKFDVDAIKCEVDDSEGMKLALFKDESMETVHDLNCKCDNCSIDVDERATLLKIEPSEVSECKIKGENLDENVEKTTESSKVEDSCSSSNILEVADIGSKRGPGSEPDKVADIDFPQSPVTNSKVDSLNEVSEPGPGSEPDEVADIDFQHSPVTDSKLDDLNEVSKPGPGSEPDKVADIDFQLSPVPVTDSKVDDVNEVSKPGPGSEPDKVADIDFQQSPVTDSKVDDLNEVSEPGPGSEPDEVADIDFQLSPVTDSKVDDLNEVSKPGPESEPDKVADIDFQQSPVTDSKVGDLNEVSKSGPGSEPDKVADIDFQLSPVTDSKVDDLNEVSKQSETLQPGMLNSEETCGEKGEQGLLSPKEIGETKQLQANQEPLSQNSDQSQLPLIETSKTNKGGKSTMNEELPLSDANQKKVLEGKIGISEGTQSSSEENESKPSEESSNSTVPDEDKKSSSDLELLTSKMKQNETLSENIDETALLKRNQEPLLSTGSELSSGNETDTVVKLSCDQEVSEQNKALQTESVSSQETAGLELEQEMQNADPERSLNSSSVGQDQAESTREDISLSSAVNQNDQDKSVDSREAMSGGNEQEPTSLDTKNTGNDKSCDASNSAVQIPSEPNSPISVNDFECPVSESDDPGSLETSDNGVGNSNDEDSDDLTTTDGTDSENKNKSSLKETMVTSAKGGPSSEAKNSSCSVSQDFCDSTVFDATSNDDLDSQDCSSSIIDSTILKGPRKRFLSNSEEDSCDSVRSKKSNGLSKRMESSSKFNGAFSDISLKRPSDITIDLDSKKLRVSDALDHDKEKMETNELVKIKTASELGISTSKTPQEPKTTVDDAIERTVAKAAAAVAPLSAESMDLPFLRRLHKKELSNMSRSDLEELVVQKICEAITERSIVGDLRLRCQALENRQEKENEKFNKLRKQMHELSLVMRKYMENQRQNKPNPPIKVTRSVGLQVCQGFRAPACNVPLRTRCPEACKLPQPVAKPASATPSKPDSSLPDALPASHQVTPLKAYKSTNSPRPPTAVASTDPPALMPASVLVVPGRPIMTPPKIQVPPLQQIQGRPRLSVPSSMGSTQPQLVQAQQKQQLVSSKPSPPQNLNQQKTANNDVEVIDIIDKDDQTKRPGVPLSSQHQQKQAANAAAQSLAGNSGMTVRLIPPTQTVPTGYSQLIGSSQGMSPRMILTSSPPGNGIRGNLKLVMKGNPGAVLIPFQQSNGVAVSSNVVHLPTSTQSAVQQIFTNAGTGNRTNAITAIRQIQSSSHHPAPLPPTPQPQAQNPAWKHIPPRPNLKIQHQNNGIVLSWNMALGPSYADIESYQLFAYQEGGAPPSAVLWKKVGDVKALPLPMACTLTQFVEGHRYHFSVRAVDKHGRVGPFSQQGSIRLGN